MVNGTGALTRLKLAEQRVTEARQVRRIAGAWHAERGMRRALEVAPSLRVETLVRSTEPDAALLELGETARMLVVGSRGRGPIGRVVHGSVGLRVSSSRRRPSVAFRSLCCTRCGPTHRRKDLHFSSEAVPPVRLAESVAGLREKYVDVTVHTAR